MEQIRREEERRQAEREQVCTLAVKLYSDTHVKGQPDGTQRCTMMMMKSKVPHLPLNSVFLSYSDLICLPKLSQNSFFNVMI